jgi:hypothetical protein
MVWIWRERMDIRQDCQILVLMESVIGTRIRDRLQCSVTLASRGEFTSPQRLRRKSNERGLQGAFERFSPLSLSYLV